MRYAGFGSRLAANFIDGMILLPVTFLLFWMRAQSPSLALFSLFLIPLAWLYEIYFIATKGQTPGKMFSEIKVIKIDGSPVTWREALLRNSVNMIFSVILLTSDFVALLHVPTNEYISTSWVQQATLLAIYRPYPTNVLSNLQQVWIWSELLVLLFNKRKRALHDFIAGTVVIEVNKIESVSQSISAENIA